MAILIFISIYSDRIQDQATLLSQVPTHSETKSHHGSAILRPFRSPLMALAIASAAIFIVVRLEWVTARRDGMTPFLSEYSRVVDGYTT